MRLFAAIYGVVCYLLFLAAFLYAIGFVTNWLVPKSIDTGPLTPSTEALLIDVLLLSVFAIQHSVMARPAFKRWWTRFVPRPIERSTYVLATNIALFLLYWQWRPLPGIVWDVRQPLLAGLIWSLAALGWIIVLLSTFMLDHFELFGLRQSISFATGQQMVGTHFRTPGLYRVVRHPIMLGFIIAFWATPTMTWGHLLFAVTTTGYILVGVSLEERDLRAHFGDHYDAYKRRVPAIIPGLGGTLRPGTE
jgi:protein-S-isoprenylcysteine O-methyltransferase Ste14